MTIYLCSCGFGTDDAGFLGDHQFRYPDHYQRAMPPRWLDGPGDPGPPGPGPGRSPEVSALTSAELERTRRELAASLALSRPGSPGSRAYRGPPDSHRRRAGRPGRPAALTYRPPLQRQPWRAEARTGRQQPAARAAAPRPTEPGGCSMSGYGTGRAPCAPLVTPGPHIP
jgi:hypothetical protein